MSEVEQLAQEQFNTFKTRLCEILCEIEEEHKSAFIQGYAKGETDEKFRTVQVVSKHLVSKHFVDLEKENTELKKRNGELAGQKASLQRWLGEAVRLLTRFVWASAYFNGEEADLVEATKQFLKEV